MSSSSSSAGLSTVGSAAEGQPLEIKVNRARVELLATKVAFVAVGVLNALAISGVFVVIVLYNPIPIEALLVSPFIAGVITALVLLKIPTMNVTAMSYTRYTNPTALLGYVSSLLLFGPLVYLIDRIDWTNYGNPVTAHVVREELINLKFEEIVETHGKHVESLKKYNFITEEQSEEMQRIYREYRPRYRALKIYNAEFAKLLAKREGEEPIEIQEPQYVELKAKIENLEVEWQTLQGAMKSTLPQPETPDLISLSNRNCYRMHQCVV